jgi:mannose-6-phosphate isomerase-like protein (cupin superfamily)
MPISVRNAADVVPEVRSSIHGGDGSFEMRFVYGGDELMSALRVFELCRLPPGTSIGEHVHEETEEIYFILSGVGTMSLDGTQREVRAGDAVLTQPIARHGIRNSGPSDLELLIVEVATSSSTQEVA